MSLYSEPIAGGLTFFFKSGLRFFSLSYHSTNVQVDWHSLCISHDEQKNSKTEQPFEKHIRSRWQDEVCSDWNDIFIIVFFCNQQIIDCLVIPLYFFLSVLALSIVLKFYCAAQARKHPSFESTLALLSLCANLTRTFKCSQPPVFDIFL